MRYLLDTNVLSETVKQNPNADVMAWLMSMPQGGFYVSVLTIGEIRKGIEMNASKARQTLLMEWLENKLQDWFTGRVLDVDMDVAGKWGVIAARAGRSLPTVDSLLAATALRHGLTLVTRNSKDFTIPGLKLFNPWLG